MKENKDDTRYGYTVNVFFERVSDETRYGHRWGYVCKECGEYYEDAKSAKIHFSHKHRDVLEEAYRKGFITRYTVKRRGEGKSAASVIMRHRNEILKIIGRSDLIPEGVRSSEGGEE
jgi:hypothetical protein